MRWILLDEVVRIEKGCSAEALSSIRKSSVSVEFLLIEMMAQTGGLVLGAERDYLEDVVFTKIESARFAPPFTENELIRIEAVADQLRPEGAWFEGTVKSAAGRSLAESRFLLMNVGHLNEGHGESLTFHKAFMEHYRIAAKLTA